MGMKRALDRIDQSIHYHESEIARLKTELKLAEPNERAFWKDQIEYQKAVKGAEEWCWMVIYNEYKKEDIKKTTKKK